MESMRLNKFLAHNGVCSRREADRLIGQGKVSVNGEIAGVGRSVTEKDQIRVGSRLISGRERPVVLAFYKPVGVTCTERDAHAEKILSDVIRYPVRVTYAGRLDKDSEGLLLLSNDGDLIQGMMKGANRHEKEYLVRVEKEITADFLRKMSNGVYLKELKLTTRPCQTEKIGKFSFQIVLTQGVNRQIRRMCQACGYQVKALKRVRVLGITLGNLKPGEYRELTAEELRELYRECAIPAKIEERDG